MEKIIIHSNISNISYAFHVAEMAYRQFDIDRLHDTAIVRKKYDYPDGITATAIQRDKCVTIIVGYKEVGYSELVEVEEDEF